MACKICGKKATEDTVDRCKKEGCPYIRSGELDSAVAVTLAQSGSSDDDDDDGVPD